MNKLQIVLNEKNFQISHMNNITSGYYVQINGFSFPSKQWVDLSMAVVEMWLVVMNRHLLCLENDAVLYFMDGDYEIRLHKKTDYCSLALFVEPDGNIAYSTTIDSLYLARQILSVSAKITSFLQKNTDSCRTEKIEALSSALISTVQALHKAKNIAPQK